MKRRLLIAALLPVLLDPLAIWSVVRKAPHECRDHVCACASHCPPRRDRPCHESRSSDQRLSAVCDHDQAPSLAAGAPALLPAEAGMPAPCAAPAGQASIRPGPLSGTIPPDPPPPRAA